ncbi:MAG: 3-phosphoglycerate dehydrogenase, partial [Clostridia bacterium]|nr:3-phosphoglycerate dehydrogenase [Clostridia bacterium]
MTNIKLYNKISPVGLAIFDKSKYNVGEDVAAPEGILVRSAALHEEPFGKELLCIARAGAGVNNIPIDRCSENGIVVFNTPGANANGVKELAIAALLLASRDVVGGIEWAKTLKGDPDVAKAVE